MRLLMFVVALLILVIPRPALAAPAYGVNLASGGFGDAASKRPYGFEYIYPSNADIDLVKSMGGKFVRLVVLPERIQPVRMGSLSPEVERYIRPLIAHARARGIVVIIDVHSFGQYLSWSRSERIDFARRLLWEYRNLTAAVVFELDNEPIAVANSLEAAHDTRDDMRAAKLRNKAIIPAPGWSSAYAFATNGVTEYARLRPDPIGNTLYAAHIYFDVDSSGTHDECVAGAAARIDPVIASGVPTAITEVSATTTPICLAEWAKFRAKVAAAPNVKMVAIWQLAWWAGDYHYALGKDGKPTALWRALMAR